MIRPYEFVAPTCLGLIGAMVSVATAQPATVFDVQYTADPRGNSPYEGHIIDCSGGIVVGKFRGTRPRVIVQDPAFPDGWGGIQVKDWTLGDLFDQVRIGDWISLTNVLVEEYVGTTFLQWQRPDSGFTIISRGNPLPPAIEVTPSDIPAPIRNAYDEWLVENHDAELYESMRLVVQCTTVTERHLGKAADNYNLRGSAGGDCWAADYMNEDRGSSGYHPFVAPGQQFCALSGVFEQYTNLRDGWDYYQLVTLSSDDLTVSGDSDGDGDADLIDWPRLVACATGPHCDSPLDHCEPPEWTQPPLEWPLHYCQMADVDCDGDVDLADASVFLGLLETP